MRDVTRETIELQISQSAHDRNVYITAVLPEFVVHRYGTAVVDKVMLAVAERLADKFIELHGDAILAEMTPKAAAGAITMQATQVVAEKLTNIADAITSRPKPITHVHVTNRNFNSIF